MFKTSFQDSFANELNPIETMVLSHRENTYTALIAWLLRTNTIELHYRLAFLEALTGPLPFSVTRINSQTEWNDIDLIIELISTSGEICIIALEHKLKSTESDKQLDAYDNFLNSKEERIFKKLFLTLAGRTSVSGNGWAPCSYNQLFAGLSLISESANVYAQDYRDAIGRLNTCLNLLSDSLEFQKFVFDGTISTKLAAGIYDYVQQFRLRMPLQREWMAVLGQRVMTKLTEAGLLWEIELSETNGTALINFIRFARVNGKEIRYGLQLQYWQLKAFAQPWPYLKEADESSHTAVKQKVNLISALLDSPSKPSTPRKRGFSSVNVFKKRNVDDRYNLEMWTADIVNTLINLSENAIHI